MPARKALQVYAIRQEHELSDEHGTGSHDPYALTNQEHTYAGSFTYASYLVNGANVITRAELLALTHALENQADEGQSVYFDIYIIEVHGNRTPESGCCAG